MQPCYHCNEPVPPGTKWSLPLQGEERHFCCPGCRAVAQLIDSSGLSSFYEFRIAPGRRPAEPEKDDDIWAVCDRPDVRNRLVAKARDDSHELRFRVDGINCAACSWLIDRGLRSIDGVEEVSVNPITRDALIRFDPQRVKVSDILGATQRFGFEPRLGGGLSASGDTRASREQLKRLAVAGLGFAQIMTLSAALYLGAFKSMDAAFTNFFILASMIIATPVVLYAGAPIFRSALADLSRGRIGMDVPVSLAIAIALAASLINAWRGEGHVYFDSATMFVFFLTLGRFLEVRARYRAGNLVSALAELRPISALRQTEAGVERVGTIELVPGDVVIVEPGEAVPADGQLLSERARVDESLLSGEALGQLRHRGERILGGSLNAAGAPLRLSVSQSGPDGYVEQVGNLVHRATLDKPDFLQTADRWAGAFVIAVLIATALAAAFWIYFAPERALEVVLAMLVVTCPCALSLAAPTAFAVALGRLARMGLLCRSARVFDRLTQVGVWLFDKTGTLTEGRIGIERIDALTEVSESRCIELAAALETGIEHPIARALARVERSISAEDIELDVGFGVTGRIGGQTFRLGSARHVGLDASRANENCVWLADETRVLARLHLADVTRPNAKEAIARLASAAPVELVSGDGPLAVRTIADALGISTYFALQTPADKLNRLRSHQQAGLTVAAVGDGVNDAPLLAQADVSIAMVEGSRLAQASADVVFTGNDLKTLAQLPVVARRTQQIVRQNLAWAAAYNLAAVPLAACGLLAPWMAAIGMSLSSLVVVGNALRLHKLGRPASEQPEWRLTPTTLEGRLSS